MRQTPSGCSAGVNAPAWLLAGASHRFAYPPRSTIGRMRFGLLSGEPIAPLRKPHGTRKVDWGPMTHYLFASYASQDTARAAVLIGALRDEFRLQRLDTAVWEPQSLRPGENWGAQIAKALQGAEALLVFVSEAAVRSEWFRQAITMASDARTRPILPVFLELVPRSELPPSIADVLGFHLYDVSDSQRVHRVAMDITGAFRNFLRTTPVELVASDASEVAETIAEEVRSIARATTPDGPPDSVFLVHGHDSAALSDMEAYLDGVGIKAFILSRSGGAAQSLFQRFLKTAADARFAIVIVSADDLGVSRVQYSAKGIGERALQFRARQNVILELGFFYGLLGWENVFVLFRPPDEVFPNFERPSDIEGVLFDQMDASGKWRVALAQKLTEAGFHLRATYRDPTDSA